MSRVPERRLDERTVPEQRRRAPQERVLDPRLQTAALIGNSAFTRVARGTIQRLRTKPHTPGGLAGTLELLEEGVTNGDDDSAARAASFLHASSPLYLVDLLRYKLTKHGPGSDKSDPYLRAAPDAAKVTTLQVACEHREASIVARLLKFYFSLSGSQRLVLARRCDAAFYVRHLLVPAREKLPAFLVPVLEQHELMQYLEAHAPTDYATFAAATPQLRVVAAVQAAAPDDATKRHLINAIFRAIIDNTGIDIAYMATALTPTAHALTGDTTASRALHDQQAAMLPGIPDIPATDCHHLLSMFETILRTYPDLDPELERVTLTSAVMTGRLTDTPGGLIARTFAGNVFNDAGLSLRRIFFTGEDGANSHSWVKANGRSYDILFGTTGVGVRDAVDGEFAKTKVDTVYREIGGARFLIATPTLAVPANAYSFNTAYRLTNDPSRHGIDPATL